MACVMGLLSHLGMRAVVHLTCDSVETNMLTQYLCMCMPCSSQMFCAQALWSGPKLGRQSGALKITFSESGISSVSVLSYVGKYGFSLFLPVKVKPVSSFIAFFE